MNNISCLLLRLILFAGLILPATVVKADTTVEIDGLTYTIVPTTRTATVTSYSSSLPADVTIPSTVTYNEMEMTVTAIADKAFTNCTKLVSISIPATVTQVGTVSVDTNGTGESLPFYGCTSLKRVRFEDGKQSISLGARLYPGHYENNRIWYFKEGYGLFYTCPLEEVYIGRIITYKDLSYTNEYARPAKMTVSSNPQYFGYSAFYNKSKLAKVTISSSVTVIPPYLFYKNSSLTTIELPKVQYIRVGAFQECSKLTTLNFGTDLVTVDDSAFEGCKNVTKLTFPNTTTTIGTGAFKDCCSLVEITVGSGLKTIGANAFRNCSSFTALVAPDNFTRMDSAAFYGCKKLTVAKLGKSLTAVPAEAFYDCIALSEVDIPATATSIGNKAFCNDSTLAVVTMREGLKTIGDEVFWNNSGITKFTIPSTVKSIGANCFYGCI